MPNAVKDLTYNLTSERRIIKIRGTNVKNVAKDSREEDCWIIILKRLTQENVLLNVKRAQQLLFIRNILKNICVFIPVKNPICAR